MNTENRTAIVTGANGFVGKKIVKELLNKGYIVYGITRNETLLNNDNYINIMADVDEDLMCKFNEVEKIDYFFHFAWNGVSGEEQTNYVVQVNNIMMSCKYAELANKLNCSKFIFAGSIFEYENSQSTLAVFDASIINKCYGYAKYAAHQMCRTICLNNKMEFNSCLISNIYGPNEVSKRFVTSFINAVKNNNKFALSKCDQPYDFIYIDDAVEAIILVAERGDNRSEYYIGNASIQPLKDYLFAIKNAINKQYTLDIGVLKIPATYFNYDQLNVNKIRKELGFKPKYDIVSGVLKTIGGEDE